MSVTHCSGPHNLSCLSGSGIQGSIAQLTRHFGAKILKAELYGKVFPNSDAAFAAMYERGYGTDYFPRSSVPLPTFAGLKCEQAKCRFDALYRYWQHLKKGKSIHATCVEGKLKRLAKSVGIFHPCSKTFTKD